MHNVGGPFMKFVRNLLAGTAATVLMTGTAMAADVIYPTVPAAAPVVIAPAPAFSFAGGYIGTHFAMSFPFGSIYGVQSGYNFVRGNFLFGVEVETSHIAILGPLVDASLNGRAGVVLGDRVLVYGQAGIGTRVVAPSFNVGAGIEVALSPRISMFAEYDRYYVIGSGFLDHQLVAGLNFHGDGAANVASGDWGGIYMGTAAGYSFAPVPFFNVGVQSGYNFDMGRLVFGVEVETTHTNGLGSIVNASLNGRVGVDLGRLLVYGEAGIGAFIAQPIWTAGGGVELALTDRMSVFAEANIGRVIGGGGSFGTGIQAGVNFHFGR